MPLFFSQKSYIVFHYFCNYYTAKGNTTHGFHKSDRGMVIHHSVFFKNYIVCSMGLESDCIIKFITEKKSINFDHATKLILFDVQ